MDIPPVNIGPERIISSCDGVVIKEKDLKYRVRQTSIYVHGVEYYNATEVDRYIAHQKYKRCLAMARWCYSMDCRMLNEASDNGTYFKESWCWKRASWYGKWKRKWLELAENFEEATNGL